MPGCGWFARAVVGAADGSGLRRGLAGGLGFDAVEQPLQAGLEAGVGWDARLVAPAAAAKEAFDHRQLAGPSITWFGWDVPIALQIFTVFALGMAMLGIAIVEFNAGE